MIDIDVNMTTTVTRDHRLTLYGKQIRELVNEHLAADRKPLIPANAEIQITVPGGGDWSNSELDLNEHPVVITWTTRDDL
jgi:hypothetical protein